MPDTISIEVLPGETITARAYASASSAKISPVLILAHGAGANQSSAFMVDTATHLATRNVTIITFDFLYTERKRRLPDRPDVLEKTWRVVLAKIRERYGAVPIFAGGKSMGGRIASQVASDPSVGGQLAGLVFLGYPLHPPGKPTQLRTKHLPSVICPMLFVQGARDPFGTEEELRPWIEKLSKAELFVVAGGDHSFKVPKKNGVPQSDVFSSIENVVATWIDAKLPQK